MTALQFGVGVAQWSTKLMMASSVMKEGTTCLQSTFVKYGKDSKNVRHLS